MFVLVSGCTDEEGRNVSASTVASDRSRAWFPACHPLLHKAGACIRTGVFSRGQIPLPAALSLGQRFSGALTPLKMSALGKGRSSALRISAQREKTASSAFRWSDGKRAPHGIRQRPGQVTSSPEEVNTFLGVFFYSKNYCINPPA